MKLTHEELAALPDRVRAALASGSVTIEEPTKEWQPEGAGYVAWLAGRTFSMQPLSHENIAIYRSQGIARATEQQAELLLKDRQSYCRLHAYRAQYAPDYVEPPFGEFVYSVGFAGKTPMVFESGCRMLNEITMPHWLCDQLVADIKSGRYKL